MDAVREFRFVRRRDSIDDDRLLLPLLLVLVPAAVVVVVGLVLLLLLISDCWRRRKVGFDTFIVHMVAFALSSAWASASCCIMHGHGCCRQKFTKWFSKSAFETFVGSEVFRCLLSSCCNPTTRRISIRHQNQRSIKLLGTNNNLGLK